MTLDPRTVDELIHHMPVVAERAANDWAKGFARSVVRQSRRRGWSPSPKQRAMMARLVSELFTHAEGDDLVVIEDYPEDERIGGAS